jgi:hypothetical protein
MTLCIVIWSFLYRYLWREIHFVGLMPLRFYQILDSRRFFRMVGQNYSFAAVVRLSKFCAFAVVSRFPRFCEDRAPELDLLHRVGITCLFIYMLNLKIHGVA